MSTPSLTQLPWIPPSQIFVLVLEYWALVRWAEVRRSNTTHVSAHFILIWANDLSHTSNSNVLSPKLNLTICPHCPLCGLSVPWPRFNVGINPACHLRSRLNLAKGESDCECGRWIFSFYISLKKNGLWREEPPYSFSIFMYFWTG